jgi:3-deoxy-D-manno-octulosonate 8-phosphate phosphatase KdsC-like HAD superfamily phosphatase
MQRVVLTKNVYEQKNTYRMSNKPTYSKNALKFKRFNTKSGTAATDLFEYEFRTSVIKNPAGDDVFRTWKYLKIGLR